MKNRITLALALTCIIVPIVLADQIPPVVRGTYRAAGLVKDRHGYISGNSKGSVAGSNYNSTGIKIILSSRFARASIFFTPSGHYRVVANGGSKIVGRSGRWATITGSTLPIGKVSTTFQFPG